MRSASLSPAVVDDIPQSAPPNDEWAAKREVAAAIRRLSSVLASSRPSIDALRAAASTINALADSWEQCPRLYGRHEFCAQGSLGNYAQITGETAAMHGQSNPIAPPVYTRIDRENGVSYGHATPGWQYEGPPGTVHGGIIASIMDNFLGVTQSLCGQTGVTGTLKLRYHARTPLNARLTMKGWVEKSEGRKTITKGLMFFGDTLTAEAEALFIVPQGGMAGLNAPAGAGSAKQS